ncbi:PE family protein, partial [Mycobacterium persicum]
MSFVIAAPDTVASAASDLATIGSTIGAANGAAAAPTTNLLAAAEDEVSAAIAAFFGAHAQAYQTLSAQAQAFHQQFVQALNAGAASYASAEAANVSPLQQLLNAINAPVQNLTGRPLIGNGANGAPGTGQNGGDAGWLIGNGGNGGSGAMSGTGTGLPGGNGGAGGLLFGTGGAGGAGGFSSTNVDGGTGG